MKTSLFRKPLRLKAFSQFMDTVHQSHMCYAMQDIVSIGLKPQEIQVALKRAMVACEQAGVQVHLHFHPRYASEACSTIYECKLSKLGYQLTLLNADPRHRQVARFQLQLLGQGFKN